MWNLQCRRHRTLTFDPWVRGSPGGGNGNPFQYPCLQNPLDRGGWWAAVHGVAKSQTQLKRLSMQAFMYVNECMHREVNMPSKLIDRAASI